MALPDDIEPSIRAALEELAALGLVTPDPVLVAIAAARRVNEAYFGYIAEPMAEIARSVRVSITGKGGQIELKLIFPNAEPAKAAMLYFHGGGFAFASLHTHERLMRQLAVASGAVVVGVEYRRTPEHPYPAALQDAEAAWHWLVAGGEGRFGKLAIGLVGDSAGANLALALAMQLRDAGARQADALGLIYGMYDRAMQSASHARYGDWRYGLSTARLEWFWSQYLSQQQDATDPLAVPALGDVVGLPPVAAFIAERDCLADDTHALVAKLAAADVPHSLDVFEGFTHGSIQLGALAPVCDDALGLIGKRMAALMDGTRSA
ncbi:MAG: alpha/beta hydrolase fold domain-containing protein [Bosea sp. (in: a-proteobacteria)]